jgi:hypothetical protein
MPLAAFPKCYLDDLVVRKTLRVEDWIDRAADALPIDGLEFYWGFTPHEDGTPSPGCARGWTRAAWRCR